LRLHEFAIDQLIKGNDKIKRNGFKKDFKKRIRRRYKEHWDAKTEEEKKEYWAEQEEYKDEFECGWKADADFFVDEIMGDLTRVPDAYRICEFCKTVFMYEVEDSHKITAHKMADLANLWFYLDCEYWDLVLYSVDRYGETRTYVNLMAYWYAKDESLS
tara:strand:- start:572 stop:1048 length:477 start_codon:yes stop_codon:yes gene_type:complete